MHNIIKVLVVDDSAFMRKMLSDIINNNPDMEAVKTARDWESAIRLTNEIHPDVVTLDIEMPHTDKIEVLKKIKESSDCEVIILSNLTLHGSSITIEALEMGAFDFVQKPKYQNINEISDELSEKIRYAYIKKENKNNLNINNKYELVPHQNLLSYEAVVLGASTGGPKVLFDVITKLPADLNVPVFVVQHMPKGFTKAFAERLDKFSKLKVVEASDDEKIDINTVYVAPGGYHLLVANEKIKLDLSPPVHGVRPSVDKLFISASKAYGNAILGCIFTGMGKDGTEGARVIKSKGGFIIAQDEATSVVYGMPKSVLDAGYADMVLPDYRIADEIVKAVKRM